jgi:DNA-binding NtrC family response regulator
MDASRPRLLLVDDDAIIAESLKYVLSPDFAVDIAADRVQAIECLAGMDEAPQLALVDLGLPPDIHLPDEGLAVIDHLHRHYPETRVLVLSGQDAGQQVEQALQRGASDFIPKPCDVAELKMRLKRQLEPPTEEEPEMPDRMGIIGQSPAVELLREQIRQLADSPYPLLIQGESGSGKELVALNLHRCSARAAEPFLTLNCAAFNGELLESQLFGHARGAFTGALEARAGFFEEAGAGSLLLDEIADLPLDLQAKLLRVLENGEFYRLGETRPRQARCRVLAASNQDLLRAVAEGRFREDLYHRLSVLTLRVPALRERDGDKRLLLEHFQRETGSEAGGFRLDDEAMALWMAHEFPGNVRELRNVVIRLSAKYPGQTIKAEVLRQELQPDMTHRQSASADAAVWLRERLQQPGFQLGEALRDIERQWIDLALEQSDNNMSRAAGLLGINRSTLYGRLERVGSPEADDE